MRDTVCIFLQTFPNSTSFQSSVLNAFPSLFEAFSDGDNKEASRMDSLGYRNELNIAMSFDLLSFLFVRLLFSLL